MYCSYTKTQHSLTQSLAITQSLAHSITQSLRHSQSLNHSITHNHSQSLNHSLCILQEPTHECDPSATTHSHVYCGSSGAGYYTARVTRRLTRVCSCAVPPRSSCAARTHSLVQHCAEWATRVCARRPRSSLEHDATHYRHYYTHKEEEQCSAGERHVCSSGEHRPQPIRTHTRSTVTKGAGASHTLPHECSGASKEGAV